MNSKFFYTKALVMRFFYDLTFFFFFLHAFAFFVVYLPRKYIKIALTAPLSMTFSESNKGG